MRGDTNDFAVVFTGRAPCVKIGKEYQPLTDQVPTEGDILEMLAAIGGFPYIDKLGADPSVWRAVEDSLGPLQITAARARACSRPEWSTRCAAPVSSPQPAARATVPNAQRPFTPSYETPAATPVAKRSSPPRSVPGPRGAFNPRFESLLAAAEARTRGAGRNLHAVAARPPLYRIAGELVPSGPPRSARTIFEAMVPAFGTAAPVRRAPEGRRLRLRARALAHGRFRVNVSRQRTGLKASLPRSSAREVPTLESLGLPDGHRQGHAPPPGLIVVTGPTGHGKTSTLAAIVDIINRETTHHIITVEDPVEYMHPRKRAHDEPARGGHAHATFAARAQGLAARGSGRHRRRRAARHRDGAHGAGRERDGPPASSAR